MSRHRFLSLTVLIVLAFGTSVVEAQKRRELWSCEADFGNGGTGTLEFKVTRSESGGSLHGSTEVRGGKQEIDGFLQGETIRFTRLLSATSKQDFKGAAVQVDAKTLRMGGRFAAGFRGVWSADCTLMDAVDVESPEPQEESKPQEEPKPREPAPGPTLQTRTSPSAPTSDDRVRFIAEASHRAGVGAVSIYVNGKLGKSCTGDKCELVGGPYPAGTVRWHVAARARDNSFTEGAVNLLRIRRVSTPAPPPPTTGTCSISGSATGSRRDSARVFQVFLSGPHDLRKSTSFGPGSFRFQDLPDGRYTISVDTKADIGVRVSPPSRTVTCSGRAITGVDFVFQ